MQINFKGNEPSNHYYNLSVQGDNETDFIEFRLNNAQGLINLVNFTPCVKLENDKKTFANKDYEIEKVIDGEEIILKYILKEYLTVQSSVKMQLLFEDAGSKVWQTQIFNVNFSDTLKIEKTIVENPNLMQKLSEQITNDVLEIVNNSIEDDAIKSVNGKVGNVVLTAEDVGVDLSAISDAISNESNRAMAAESSLSAAISLEETRATAAEVDLSTRITNVDSEITNIEAKVQSLAATVGPLNSALEARLNGGV